MSFGPHFLFKLGEGGKANFHKACCGQRHFAASDVSCEKFLRPDVSVCTDQ